jgi:hypothetical protein
MKCRPALQIFLSALVIFLLSNSVLAVTIDNLNSIVIQVTDTSLETRAKVLPQAFEQVMRRVASSHSAVAHAEFTKAKQNVDAYINTFFYTANPGSYNLTVQFNEQALADLLTKMGRNSFSKNRPQVLLWLVADQDNKPQFVNSSSQEPLADKIDLLSSNYGLPILFPLLDLTERLFIAEQDIVNFNLAPLQQAAGRYNADSVVVGKINHISGIWHCEWRLLDGQQDVAWNSSGDDLDVELELMFNQLADKLIASYKVPDKSLAVNKNSIAVRVKGVNNVADYAKVLAYLKNLSVVQQVEIGSVDGNQAMFMVSSEAGKEAVIKALNMDTLLAAESDIDATLIYRINS